MRIRFEDEILDSKVRAAIIEEIEAPENRQRKDAAYRRFEVWKDKTSKFVLEMLHLQFAQETVREMQYALSNISIVRKIIDKLAKVYSHGIIREFDDDTDTACLNKLEKRLKMTAQMKTLNRLLKLHRNTTLYVKPTEFLDADGNSRFTVDWQPMSPYLYDVVEGFYDRTKSMVHILSNFDLRGGNHAHHGNTPDAFARRSGHHGTGSGGSLHGVNDDRKDNKIADEKEERDIDLPKKKYVWWTDKWHFTTLGEEIVDPSTMKPFAADIDFKDAISNPIEESPFVDYHIDQEGNYWAEGGEDLVDGAILINSLLTNAHHIGVTQGFGQLVLTGKDLPSTISLGPNKMIGLPQESTDDPTPTAEFITSSPPLEALAKQAETQLALLMTTNNLSTSGIASSLEGGMTAPSGIALTLDKAESLEDVKDQTAIFAEGEIPAIKKTALWLQHFKETNQLDEELDDCIIPSEEDVQIQFNAAQIIMSESEKLADLKSRQDLGLNLKVELIMKDRGIDRAQADEILVAIEAEKTAAMMDMMGGGHTHDLNGSNVPTDNVGEGEPHDHGGSVTSAPNTPGHTHESAQGATGPRIDVGSNENEGDKV